MARTDTHAKPSRSRARVAASWAHSLRSDRALLLFVLLVVVAVFASSLVPSSVGAAPSSGNRAQLSPAVVPHGGESAARTAPASSAVPTSPSSPSSTPSTSSPGSANTPCYNLNATICISVASQNDPNIIPAPGTHVSNVHPLPNVTINLYVRSQFPLVWTGNFSYSGPHSPLALNATGVLWNGDPYYSAQDGTMWHPAGNAWWSFGPTNVNRTYPYYYDLTFSPRSSGGGPNFFPGMTLTWWVFIVTNTSGHYGYVHNLPTFQFTFGGAWPASPYPGPQGPGGSGAVAQDVAVSQTPLAPNYNDSVNVTIATTPLDLTTAATIGGAYLDLTESAPDGAVLTSTSLPFPVTVTGGVGAVQSTLVLAPSFATYPGALVTYRVSAWDMSEFASGQVGPDLVTTATFNYTVNGNGSFATGRFVDDLAVSTVPSGPGLGGSTVATVPAGTPVNVLLSSQVTTTSIEAAQVLLSFSYPGINETVNEQIPLARVNSTHFGGTIPGLPLGSVVSYRLEAWDFDQASETSAPFNYVTPTLPQWLPSVPLNSSFLVVYVYDGGTGHWVSGASVTIAGLVGGGYVRSSSTTFGGIAYPNQTGQPFVPLLLAAGTSYRIWVNDSSFLPNGATVAPSVSLTTLLPHSPTESGIRSVGSDYVIAQSGSAFYFWLNQTISSPGLVFSPSESPSVGLLVGAAVGIAAAALAIVPLAFWWSSIQKRRVEQERRITL